MNPVKKTPALEILADLWFVKPVAKTPMVRGSYMELFRGAMDVLDLAILGENWNFMSDMTSWNTIGDFNMLRKEHRFLNSIPIYQVHTV